LRELASKRAVAVVVLERERPERGRKPAETGPSARASEDRDVKVPITAPRVVGLAKDEAMLIIDG